MNITQLEALGASSPQVDEKLKLLNKPVKARGWHSPNVDTTNRAQKMSFQRRRAVG